MPLRLNCGVNKKIGQPDFGSLGASCNVEIELDGSLLVSDLDTFHDRVRLAFSECRKAVDGELARHSERAATAQDSPSVSASAGNDHNGNATNGHRATEKQLGYARQLAGQIRGLGVRRLESLATKMFNKPVADLSSLDASGLIDTLKAVKAGEVNLDDALNGAAV